MGLLCVFRTCFLRVFPSVGTVVLLQFARTRDPAVARSLYLAFFELIFEYAHTRAHELPRA